MVPNDPQDGKLLSRDQGPIGHLRRGRRAGCQRNRGRTRRRAPRFSADDLVSLDGESLHRAEFLRGVALTSGRLVAPEAPDTPFGVESDTLAPHDLEGGLPRQTILVAEDNAINQKVLRRQLALLGFEADIVANGREALERWRGANYALLITDLHMPQMDGYELAALIRAAETDHRHIPTVAGTANAVKGEAKRCREVGMDGYMTKPLQLSALNGMILRWLSPPATAQDRVEATAPKTVASNRPTQASPNLADLNVLAALVGDDPGEMAEVLAMFHTNSEQLRDEIRQGISSGNLQAVADAAHKLKSNARSIGAFSFGQTCADIEQVAEAGNSQRLRGRLAPFEAELAALCDYLVSVHPSHARELEGSGR